MCFDLMIEKLEIQEIDESFLALSYAWFRDKSLRQLTLTSPVNRASQMEWYHSLPARQDYKIWGVKLENEWVGAFGLKHIDLGAHHAYYWGYIGDPQARGRGVGRWMLRNAIILAVEYNIQTLYLKVWKENTVALNLYTSMDFIKISEEHDVFLMEKNVG